MTEAHALDASVLAKIVPLAQLKQLAQVVALSLHDMQ